jgi:hypothetical protein
MILLNILDIKPPSFFFLCEYVLSVVQKLLMIRVLFKGHRVELQGLE